MIGDSLLFIKRRDELLVERMDSLPGAYSSVPVMDVTPINLEDLANEMFEIPLLILIIIVLY